MVTEKQLPSFETEIIQTVLELVKAVIKWCIRTKRILKIKPHDVCLSINFEETQTKGIW
jgi:hypothetical protein